MADVTVSANIDTFLQSANNAAAIAALGAATAASVTAEAAARATGDTKINGVTVSGTPATGKVPTATSSTTASWQTPSASGGLSYLSALAVVGGTSPSQVTAFGTWRNIALSGTGASNLVLDATGASTNDRVGYRVTVVGHVSNVPILNFYNEVASGTALATFTGSTTQGIADVEFIFNGTAWELRAGGDMAFEESADVTAPTVSTFSPADNATDVAVSANLVVTFSEPVVAVTGNITIIATAGPTTFATIAVGDTSQVTIAGAVVTINPTSNLAPNTAYHVLIAASCFDDTSSNSFAGIASATTWNFVTAAAAALPGTPAFDLDAATLTGFADGDSILSGADAWDDASANDNDLTTATSGVATYSATGGRFGRPAIQFHGNTTIGQQLTLDTEVVLTDFSFFCVCKGTAPAALLLNADGSQQIASLFDGTASGTYTTDGDGVTGATPLRGGCYASVQSGTLPEGDANATWTTTISSGKVTAITITGAGTNYTVDGVVNFATGLPSLLCYNGEADSTNSTTATSFAAYSVCEIHRTGTTVTFFKESTAINAGTQSVAAELTASKVGFAFTGYIERAVLYASYIAPGSTRDQVRAALA